MKAHVVIDTNVLVSALLAKRTDSAPVQILDRLFNRDFIAHLRSGDDRRKWCAFVSNFGAQNRPKKMLYIDSQIIKRCA